MFEGGTHGGDTFRLFSGEVVPFHRIVGEVVEFQGWISRALTAGLEWAAISGCLWAAVVSRWGDAGG
jgi:hypothetical protein